MDGPLTHGGFGCAAPLVQDAVALAGAEQVERGDGSIWPDAYRFHQAGKMGEPAPHGGCVELARVEAGNDAHLIARIEDFQC